MSDQSFASRHIGPRDTDIQEMLSTIGVDTVEELLRRSIPDSIRLENPLDLDPAMGEHQYIKHLHEVAGKNKVFSNFIGMGYHDTVLPGVIQRNILENPGWYTAYTPYQAEIAQGRLEALINYQTMITDLTGMELANSSLLDEPTAAAEAMSMLYSARPREQKDANLFFVSRHCLPQTLALLETRAEPIGIQLVIGDHREVNLDSRFFGALLQYPAGDGAIFDYREFAALAKENNVKIAVAADIMALVLLEAPGKWGADVVVGTSQRFGIPLGYGGPHAAFFATHESMKRFVPGRIIGQTIDSEGNPALRMALQTREQHIKRDRATSNICTAQVLLAVMAGMYGVYHGPQGLKNIAKRIHHLSVSLADGLKKLGFELGSSEFFDTIEIELDTIDIAPLRKAAESRKMNFRYISNHRVGISLNETCTIDTVQEILEVFAEAAGVDFISAKELDVTIIPNELLRNDDILTYDVFNKYHSETEMMRYIKRLERKDLSLNHSMIPLGSCTMKLNAAAEMIPVTWPQWANIHPFAPLNQAEGYQYVIREMERYLAEITGFAGVSLQPNSGAQGEYAGLMVIRAYHQSRGDHHRNIVLIPSSAHGTNPASAVMAGMEVVVVKCDDHGNIDVEDLRSKAEKHSSNLSALMITYPSTHGVFEAAVKEITKIIHQHGGQVYMDGANMNAQVGLTSPGSIGADVCHLNLHKTFAIPHGGGGPGMGPICVAPQLVPFLPGHPVVKTGGKTAINPISGAPWGSGLILLISYGYMKMLGSEGLTKATELAILNANYLKAKLKGYYDILYTGEMDCVAHEMIIDCRPFKKSASIEVVDIAKRLMDYGYHAPTVSFPVGGTMMIEPTESESKEELDRFADAMIQIRREIDEIAAGESDIANNVLKNAPHTMDLITADGWSLPYSRSKAAFPMDYLKDNKFWPSVRRVDDAYGDRNLVCTCAPIESYQ
ncbi:MAG: glycine dehydrogenase (aminomethyl-transferring) [Flavobacteriales bacterium]|nr:MAG: glycine dehydrogenase (aminomethyl-transferring) [Flavobacteriales bacterium]